ncbi:MAG: hypothetical protein EXR79_05620 [Myxococcales bacterium]|nr:hypothetical protein [Myxococcales bacterium]
MNSTLPSTSPAGFQIASTRAAIDFHCPDLANSAHGIGLAPAQKTSRSSATGFGLAISGRVTANRCSQPALGLPLYFVGSSSLRVKPTLHSPALGKTAGAMPTSAVAPPIVGAVRLGEATHPAGPLLSTSRPPGVRSVSAQTNNRPVASTSRATNTVPWPLAGATKVRVGAAPASVVSWTRPRSRACMSGRRFGSGRQPSSMRPSPLSSSLLQSSFALGSRSFWAVSPVVVVSAVGFGASVDVEPSAVIAESAVPPAGAETAAVHAAAHSRGARTKGRARRGHAREDAGIRCGCMGAGCTTGGGGFNAYGEAFQVAPQPQPPYTASPAPPTNPGAHRTDHGQHHDPERQPGPAQGAQARHPAQAQGHRQGPHARAARQAAPRSQGEACRVAQLSRQDRERRSAQSLTETPRPPAMQPPPFEPAASSPGTIDFWFDFSCPYAYIASCRRHWLAAASGRPIALRPMLLGGVFAAIGQAQNLSSVLAPPKARHNRADVVRQAAWHGVPIATPVGHPHRTVDALRALLASPADAWDAVVDAFYAAYWREGASLADPAILAGRLRSVGLDAQAVLARAASDAIKAELRTRTAAAVAAGVFGAPAFVVDGALFWGADRMDMVVRAARDGWNPLVGQVDFRF